MLRHEAYLHVGIASLAALTAMVVPAQTSPFEVVSIKRNLSGSTDDQVAVAPGGRFVATNVPVRTLIRTVYRVQYSQIAGGPEWLETERWDIHATGAGATNARQMDERVKALLQDRFKLVVHIEMREAPHYALVLAHGDRTLGPLLQPDASDCAVLPPGDQGCRATRSGGGLRMSGARMSDVAFSLSRMLDRPVIDHTGLSGAYRLELKWDPNAGSPTRATSDGTSLFTSLREQVGLALDARRGLVEFLVIDSAQRPVQD